MMKRAVDVTLSGVGLVLLAPVFLMIAVLIRVSSPGPVLFRQQRVGRGLRPFVMLKFRTMSMDAERGGLLTVADDPRVTSVGRILRKTKLDEIPQLLNVLRGDMSLVGPRPEVQQYVDRYLEDFEQILRGRPGMTDPASIRYRGESELLGRAVDREKEYLQKILPEKILLAKEYAGRATLRTDLLILFDTVLALLRGKESKVEITNGMSDERTRT